MNTNIVLVLTLGVILGISLLVIILAFYGWLRNKGKRSLPLSYRINSRWIYELCKFPNAIFKTWGKNSLNVDWLDWELGICKVLDYPKINNLAVFPSLGDYIIVKAKWNRFLLLVVTSVEPQNRLETVALGYVNERH